MLKTRYTAPGFWNAGLGLFEQAQLLVSETSEKEHLKACIAHAREHLHLEDNPSQALQPELNHTNGGDFPFTKLHFCCSYFDCSCYCSCVVYHSEVLKAFTLIFLCLLHFVLVQDTFLRVTLLLIQSHQSLNGWCSQTSWQQRLAYSLLKPRKVQQQMIPHQRMPQMCFKSL